MKFYLLLGLTILITSCLSKEKNPTGLNANKMTEKDKYIIYGLEAPSEVYKTIDSIFTLRKLDYKEICEVKVKTTIVGISISLDSIKISAVEVKPSDYSVKINEMLKSSLLGLTRQFVFYEHDAWNYNFHLDLKKFCNKNFNRNPFKDSTLETNPKLNKLLD